jgi:hypothetical protein
VAVLALFPPLFLRAGFVAALVEEIALTFATKARSLSSAPDARANSTNLSWCDFFGFFGGRFLGIKTRLVRN